MGMDNLQTKEDIGNEDEIGGHSLTNIGHKKRIEQCLRESTSSDTGFPLHFHAATEGTQLRVACVKGAPLPVVRGATSMTGGPAAPGLHFCERRGLQLFDPAGFVGGEDD